MNNLFNIEELEVLRIAMSERLKTLQNRIENFKTQPNISEEKRIKNIEKTEAEYSKVALIEAKTMRELSNLKLNQ